MIDRQDLQQARDDLGRKLAALRWSRGLIQEALARQVHTTRSTLGMVERGRQVVDRIFWLQCDTLLDAQGELLAAYDAYRHLQSRFQAQQAEAAQRARWGAVPEAVMAAGEATGERYGEVGDNRRPPDRFHGERPEAGRTTRTGQVSVVNAVAGRGEEADHDARSRLLAELRRHLLAPAAPKQPVEPLTLSEVRQRVAHLHSLYQRGNYAEAVRALPDTFEQANLLTRTCTGTQRALAVGSLAAANLAAAKLAGGARIIVPDRVGVVFCLSLLLQEERRRRKEPPQAMLALARRRVDVLWALVSDRRTSSERHRRSAPPSEPGHSPPTRPRSCRPYHRARQDHLESHGDPYLFLRRFSIWFHRPTACVLSIPGFVCRSQQAIGVLGGKRSAGLSRAPSRPASGCSALRPGRLCA
ncbi:helix-turn-helix transcriptional regulator [Micromonospora humida]|uniref:helix-turn-helix transcriptional regulator n=1 Tax=Micromonospora humida TaxID=2809018 RepID=UPI0036700A65